MPGNKLYTVSRLVDFVKRPLYFGSFASLKYYVSLSDKYLVEAKILFEYKQYLLAVSALKRSDEHFKQISKYLKKGQSEGKNIDNYSRLLMDAADRHKQELVNIKEIVPQYYFWKPEADTATRLNIHELIDASIAIRANL